MRGICLVGVGLLCVCSARAGDAVAVGYNAQGLWTSVTYYCSSTPKGGPDYKDEAAAREAALRDLKRRTVDDIRKTEVIAASDKTGNFAVARGKLASGKETIVVGYGGSAAAAEDSARTQLKRAGATEQKIMYRYFSHGDESAAAR